MSRSFRCLRERVTSEDFKLVKLASGVHSVHALKYGETFHPVVGPVAEAEALYVRQLNLTERRRKAREEFVIWDIGLGAAANALTALRSIRDLHGKVRMISFDYTVAPLQFALKHAEALGYFNGYGPVLEELARSGAVTFPDGAQNVNWLLQLADFPTFLQTAAAAQLPKPHAILFDAFSPARNPAMWTEPLFASIYKLLDPARPCALATYSRSTLLRVTLLLAGFYVGAGHATGEKEETTLAANDLELLAEPLGADWLRRARNSTSAEPLTEARYRQMPLTPTTWDRLKAHAQFQ